MVFYRLGGLEPGQEAGPQQAEEVALCLGPEVGRPPGSGSAASLGPPAGRLGFVFHLRFGIMMVSVWAVLEIPSL